MKSPAILAVGVWVGCRFAWSPSGLAAELAGDWPGRRLFWKKSVLASSLPRRHLVWHEFDWLSVSNVLAGYFLAWPLSGMVGMWSSLLLN
jgi:hypothetical protein